MAQFFWKYQMVKNWKIAAFNLLPTDDDAFKIDIYPLEVKAKHWTVWWLWDESQNLKVVGSNPSIIYWMDIITLINWKNCNVCLKKAEKNKKRPGMVNFFKKTSLKIGVRVS